MEALKYSIVVPIYNEEESLADLVKQVQEVMELLDGPAEVVLVDDGQPGLQLPADAGGEQPGFPVQDPAAFP